MNQQHILFIEQSLAQHGLCTLTEFLLNFGNTSADIFNAYARQNTSQTLCHLSVAFPIGFAMRFEMLNHIQKGKLDSDIRLRDLTFEQHQIKDLQILAICRAQLSMSEAVKALPLWNILKKQPCDNSFPKKIRSQLQDPVEGAKEKSVERAKDDNKMPRINGKPPKMEVEHKKAQLQKSRQKQPSKFKSEDRKLRMNISSDQEYDEKRFHELMAIKMPKQEPMDIEEQPYDSGKKTKDKESLSEEESDSLVLKFKQKQKQKSKPKVVLPKKEVKNGKQVDANVVKSRVNIHAVKSGAGQGTLMKFMMGK